MLENVFLSQFIDSFAQGLQDRDITQEDDVSNQSTLLDRNLDRSNARTFLFQWTRLGLGLLVLELSDIVS